MKRVFPLLAIAFILLEPMPEGRSQLQKTAPGVGGARQLASGQRTASDLSAGESHSYRIDLDEGRYLHLFIEQQGIDVAVALYGPAGQMLAHFYCRDYGPTPISIIADSGGSYRFELSAKSEAQGSGHYDLRVEEVRPARAPDRQRLIAEQAVADGERLLNEWKAESSRRAIDEFKKSLSFWRAAGDRREEARTLRRIGDTCRTLGEYQDAFDVYDQALRLCRKIKDSRGEAESINSLTEVFIMWGENQKALRLRAQVVKLIQDGAHRRQKAQAINNWGEIYYALGELDRSLEVYQQALPFWRELGDRQGEALTLLNSGYTLSDQGQLEKALGYYTGALALWAATNNKHGQALTLNALGRLYFRMGESQESLGYFLRAMQLIQAIGDPIEEARIHNGIAGVYDALGEKQTALDHYAQALPLFRMAHYRDGEANTLGDSGRVYFTLGDNQKALENHQEALSIFRALGERRMEMVELKEIGRIYDAQGDPAKALKNYLLARFSYHAENDLRGEAVTLNLIGGIYEGWGQRPKARDYYDRALPLCRRAMNRSVEASTLYNIARLEKKRGNLVEARAEIEAALKVIESLRTKVASQDSRASYFDSTHQYFELYVDTLMQLHKSRPAEGFDAAAFNASEKARARSLLESLQEARADIRQGVDPSLLERERELEQELNSKAGRLTQLLASKNQVEAEEFGKQIDRLSTQHDEIRAQIKVKSPGYAALTQPQPLSLYEIQQRVLGDDLLLLEYMLGDDRSYVWSVTRTEVSSFELPGRTQIEEATLRFHKLLTAHQPVHGETFEQRQARIVEANAHIAEEAVAFSKLVLGPVVNKLGKKRLLIVPDGALQYIPFQALVITRQANGGEATSQLEARIGSDETVPLLIDHEIVNEPSASALALVMSETAARKPAPNSIAVFANPVFETDDPRVGASNSTAAQTLLSSQKTELQAAFRDLGLGDGSQIPTLPASREEANAIMAIAPRGTGFKAEGFEASRATIMRPGISQYRVVHFATHGFVDYKHPELSGLVLSLVDVNGKEQDGFLRMHDIYNLKLPVDLVVLSACNTGLGKEVKGEGLIGLTRGFMYAGAGGVVASLWKVDDDATAELMTQFYEGMFKRQLTPAAALREAQLTMSRQRRWQSPYYWAAFVLQGQYNQKEMLNPRPSAWQIGVLVALISTFPAIVFLLWRRRRRKIL